MADKALARALADMSSPRLIDAARDYADERDDDPVATWLRSLASRLAGDPPGPDGHWVPTP